MDARLELVVRAPERVLGPFPLGQIEVSTDNAHRWTARLATDRKAAREHVNVVPLLVAQPELSLVGAGASDGHALVDLAGPRHVVWMEQVFPAADVRWDLIELVAEHLRPARRVDDGAGLEVPVPDAFLRTREGEREPLFALPQQGLGAAELCQVEVGADDPID